MPGHPGREEGRSTPVEFLIPGHLVFFWRGHCEVRCTWNAPYGWSIAEGQCVKSVLDLLLLAMGELGRLFDGATGCARRETGSYVPRSRPHTAAVRTMLK